LALDRKLQAGIRSGVLDEEAIRGIAENSPWQGTPSEPLVAAYERLHSQTAALSVGLDPSATAVDLRAAQAAQTLDDSNAVWETMAQVGRVWSSEDSTFAEETLARNPDEFVEAEAEILRNNGLSLGAAAALAIAAAETRAFGSAPIPDPEDVRRETRVLAQKIHRSLTHEAAEEDREDRQFVRRLRRIGRVMHLVGGGILLLADIGSFAATALATPTATIGTGAVAVVSIKKGSDLIRLGVDDKFLRR
jgi:hypothetical protein